MNDLILHDSTKKQLSNFISYPSHALLILGPHGVGKRTIANTIFAAAFEVSQDKLENYPYLFSVPSQKNAISIDTIREIRHFLHLKTTGENQLRRGVIIERADLLTLEAQNALLKILEEPPEDTLIILTTTNSRSLLTTLASRSQSIFVRLPIEIRTLEYFKTKYDEKQVNQAVSLSGGLPGLTKALLEEDNSHSLIFSVEVAKDILQKTKFDRLQMISDLAKDKEKLNDVFFVLLRMAHLGLHKQLYAENDKQALKWYNLIRIINEAQSNLETNVSTKLLLTNLFLSI